MPAGATPRSSLSVPGSSPRMLTKAFASAADEVVIDLEDAVAPAAKDGARGAVAGFLSTLETEKLVSVRINAAGSPWCHQDLIELASLATPPDQIVLPKVESTGDLAFVDRLLTGVAGPGHGIGVQALIETAAGLLALDAIAGYAGSLTGLILGYADLAADLGRSPEPDLWQPARERLLWAARAQGLRAVDGPYLGTTVDAGFAAALATSVATGFDGKWVIHPAQLDPVNEAFSPAPSQIEEAERILARLAEAAAAGHGAVALDGAMLDEAVAVRARRTLSRAGR